MPMDRIPPDLVADNRFSKKELDGLFNKIKNLRMGLYQPEIHGKSSEDYYRLELACSIFSYILKTEYAADVSVGIKDIYYDLGSDWKWTTIVINDTQILSAKDQERILCCSSDIGKLTSVCADIIRKKIEKYPGVFPQIKNTEKTGENLKRYRL